MNKKVTGILITLLAVLTVVIFVGLSGDRKTEQDGQDQTTNQEDRTEQDPLKTEEEKVPDKVELEKKEEAPDSEWLAAAMVIAITLEYPDFDIEEIYVAEDGEKEAYIIFNSEGQKKAIHSTALKEERKESGTRDIYTKDLGFATFDETEPENINSNQMTKIEIDELGKLIEQSLLVSVYQN